MPYKSQIANEILFTPLDTKASVVPAISDTLTTEVFLSECYTAPYFKNGDLNIKHENNAGIADDTIEIEKWIRKKKDLLDSEANFYTWLNTGASKKVYTISGYSGTGKTTYINKIASLSNSYYWIILDIQNANDYIDWFSGIKTTFLNFDIPYYKMTSSICAYIKNIIFLVFENGSPNLRKTYLNILNIIFRFDLHLKRLFLPECDFFEGLRKALRFKGVVKSVRMASVYVANYFNNLQKTNLPKEVFRKSLYVLMNLVACKLYAESKKSIIVFDNFERFIKQDEIYNHDLDNIRKELAACCRDFFDNKTMYSRMFKFIMCMRNGSLRMNNNLDVTDALPSDLDLTDWFDIDEIITTKESYYSKIGYSVQNIDFLRQISGDLRMCPKNVLTGLQLFIHPLFNNNKRLRIDFLGTIIENPNNQKFFKLYNEYWSSDSSISRFAARNIIKSLIYKELGDNDNLFDHLRLTKTIRSIDKNGEENIDYGSSIMREILSVLYSSPQRSCKLSHILSIICKNKDIRNYWFNLSKDTKLAVSDVIFYMNSYNRRNNDWIQFVDIQVIGSNKTLKIERTSEMLKLINKHFEDIVLDLLPAGEMYLRYIIASFEFFSFRYFNKKDGEYTALFSTIPSSDDLLNCRSINDLQCMKIILNVYKNAAACINNIRSKNTDTFIALDLGHEPKSHITRIIQQHTGYLSNFISYMKKYFLDNNTIEQNIKNVVEELLKKVSTIISNYLALAE